MAASDAMKGDVFSLLAEIDPPKGVDLSAFLDAALAIKGRIEGIVVTDGEDAIMRMSPPAACHALLEKNMSPIMVVNGRDRNRLSLQGDLLSAHALGVRTIILKQGHDPSIGDQPMVKSSGDLDLDVMLKIISALNSGKDLGGESLEGKTEFKFGAAIDLSDDVKVNRDRADKLTKIAEYGADFVILGYSVLRHAPDGSFPKGSMIDLQGKVFFYRFGIVCKISGYIAYERYFGCGKRYIF